MLSRRIGFTNNLLPHGQRGGLTSHRPILSARSEPTTTSCAPHVRRPLRRDRANIQRAAMRSCTRRRSSRQPTPARETRMRIVKPCRPSAATDSCAGRWPAIRTAGRLRRSTMRHPDKNLSTVGDLVAGLRDHAEPGKIAWYRGQADATWGLTPTIGRNPDHLKAASPSLNYFGKMPGRTFVNILAPPAPHPTAWRHGIMQCCNSYCRPDCGLANSPPCGCPTSR
jgi:hypothetical protein